MRTEMDFWEDDCDESSPLINNAIELCDGVDNNCDGNIDEGVEFDYYRDDDGDGFGNNDDVVSGCTVQKAMWFRVPIVMIPMPRSTLLLSKNVMDGQCNAIVISTRDLLRWIYWCWWRWFWIRTGAWVFWRRDRQWRKVVTMAMAQFIRVHLRFVMVSTTMWWKYNEGLLGVWYADQDGDGLKSDSTSTGCEPPTGYVADASDCDDGDFMIHPNSTEICDYLDNNCDGVVDEGESFILMMMVMVLEIPIRLYLHAVLWAGMFLMILIVTIKTFWSIQEQMNTVMESMTIGWEYRWAGKYGWGKLLSRYRWWWLWRCFVGNHRVSSANRLCSWWFRLRW